MSKTKEKKKNTFLLKSDVAMDILRYLSKYPREEYSLVEIQEGTKRSRMGIHLGIVLLNEWGLIIRKTKGGRSLYSVDNSNPIVKQFKILNSVLYLDGLRDELKNSARKVILYGSVSRGEDTAESDIDLFIYTSEKDDVEEIIKQYKTDRKIQAAIVNPVEMSKMKEKDKEYLNEVNRGIILWELEE